MLNRMDSRTIGGTARLPKPSFTRPVPQRGVARQARKPAANSFAIWLCLIGALIPAADVTAFIGGAKFTVGRLAIAFLLIPALVVLIGHGRKMLLADFFAFATGIWMVTAAIFVGGSGTISSAGAEGLECIGGYFAARAFIYGPPAVGEFAKALKLTMLLLIIFALAEHMSGRLIIHDTIAGFLHSTPPDPQFREGHVRATATFDHAILFGAFCAFSGIILLYAETNALKRTIWVGLCIFGCVLSLSSSAMMAVFITLTVYVYDRAMSHYPWRWGMFWGLALLPLLALAALSEKPLHWILSHLTLDPVSGFFRLMIWDGAIDKIGESPIVGHGFNLLGNQILDTTVDSVWLVFALRFGLPVLVLLVLSSIAAWRSVPHRPSSRPDVQMMERMSTAFTMVLVMFMFVGLTVHYWNYMWIFWWICIGARASVREWFLSEARLVARDAQRA